MTWLRRIRPALFVLALLLAIGSLLGARLLATGSGTGTATAGATETTNGRGGSGPVVIGFVDSDPRPIELVPGLPPILQSGEVVDIKVKAGDTVEVNQILYRFDTTIMAAELKTAEKAVAVAQVKVREAEQQVKQHQLKIEAQQLRVAAAALKVERTSEGYRLYVTNLRETFAAAGQKDIEQKIKDDPERYRLETAYQTALVDTESEKTAEKALRALSPQVLIDEAKAEVARYQAVVDKAKDAIKLCTVRAQVAGTIERVNISRGDVLGISTRTPAVVLIPGGPRVVRAEIEAEFAHRVGNDALGRTVTIYDNTDSKLMYKGVIKRIGTAFLPKRGNGAEGFVPNDTRVLEAVIQVIEPTPADQPPLRVGQKVRVNLGQ